MTLLFQRRCPSLVSLILFLTVMATVSTAQARAFTLTGEGSLLPGSAVWNPSTSPAIPGPGIDNATLMPGWPITLPVSGSSLNFGPSRGLVLADIDLDGKQDVIASSTNSLVYAWDLTGTPLPGWPVTVTLMPQYAPSVADLDGDGTLEVIQATRGATSGGMIYVFNHDGTAMTGWPKAVGTKGNYATASMTCVDLDGDGTLEIIAGERDYPIGHLWVFNHDGTSFPGKWPVALDHVPTASATVGDIDKDGKMEIIYMSYNSIYAFETDGTLVAGWPYNVSAKHGANFSYQSAALSDLTGDGYLEIVTACHKSNPGCYIFRHDGTLLTGWPQGWGSGWTYSPPSVADLDKDGKPEILCGRAGNGLYCWDVQGNLRPGFPFNSGASAEGPIIVANIDGDPEMEILLDSNKTDASGKGWIYAIDHKGKLESGWPIQPQGVTYMNNCSVADVDGDGVMELAQISYSSQQRSSYVGLWKIAGSTYLPSKIQWWTYHENNPRTGLQHQGFRLTGSGPTTIGGAFTVQVKANPGNETYIALGITAIRQPLPPFGIFRLLPPLATLVYGIIPTTGTFGYNQPIPNIPALRGVTVYFQALEGMSVAAGHATFTDLLSITLR